MGQAGPDGPPADSAGLDRSSTAPALRTYCDSPPTLKVQKLGSNKAFFNGSRGWEVASKAVTMWLVITGPLFAPWRGPDLFVTEGAVS
jgi:hypothetical protein